MTHGRTWLFKLLMPIVIFGVAEMSARACDVRTKLGLAERRGFAAYQGKPWLDQYLKDSLSCVKQTAAKGQPRYSRYVLQTINEDCATPTVNYRNRLRKTWNPAPGDPAHARVIEVGMFGGSTMEGLGAIDDETIPSFMSKLLNASAPDGVMFHVTNYGVSAYTYTQSVFRLMTLLRDGAHVDIAVFYNGANDTDYAYENGEAGALDGEDVLERKVEGSAFQRAGGFAKDQMNACVLCMAAGMAVRHTPWLGTHVSPLIVRARDAIHFKKGKSVTDVDAMARSIADYYAQSHDLLDHVVRSYGIARVEFWQPSLMYDSGYGPGESPLSRMDPRLTDPTLRSLYLQTRDRVLAKPLPALHDLSHALDGRSAAVYLDAVHISGDGNSTVANAIVPFVNALVHR